MKLDGLLISAGLSGRMGAFKPLMDYKGEPFVVAIVRKLLQVCNRVIVVTGYKNDEVESLLNSQFSILNSQLENRLESVFNQDFNKGMFTSLQAGLKKMIDSDWALYHFVDQPFHSEKFYEELILQIDHSADWIQPVYKGKEGHPVIFRKTIFERILTSPSNIMLRTIRDDEVTKKKYWECGYSQILKDFDTKEDIENFHL